MDYLNHVLWSETKINLFGLDGVNHVWRQPGEEYKDKCILPTVKHGGGSVIVWSCMSAAGTGELQFTEGTMNADMYCDILKQSIIPSLWRLGRRAVFQHDNDPCLAKEAEGKGDGLAKHVSRPKPYWASVGHPQMEGGVAQGCHQLRDVVMEKWKRTPVATCEALVNSMPKRVKAVLENNSGHTKYWHSRPNLDILT